MKNLRGFASVYVLLVLLVMALAGGGAYLATHTSPVPAQPTIYQTYIGEGFKVSIPTSWQAIPETNGFVSLSSPDYIPKPPFEISESERRGEATGIVKQGALIQITPRGENPLSKTIQDPAAYVRFWLDMGHADQTESKEISLGGQPAWLLQTRRDDGSLLTTVQTTRNGKEFLISLFVADKATMDWAAWDTFLSNFTFIAAPVVEAHCLNTVCFVPPLGWSLRADAPQKVVYVSPDFVPFERTGLVGPESPQKGYRLSVSFSSATKEDLAYRTSEEYVNATLEGLKQCSPAVCEEFYKKVVDGKPFIFMRSGSIQVFGLYEGKILNIILAGREAGEDVSVLNSFLSGVTLLTSL